MFNTYLWQKGSKQKSSIICQVLSYAEIYVSTVFLNKKINFKLICQGLFWYLRRIKALLAEKTYSEQKHIIYLTLIKLYAF